MLKRYLPSVVEHCPHDSEVVVADNGSTDGSLALLTESFPSVRLIKLDRNYGFAEGYNKAIEQIDSTYVVLLNSDVEVTDGWLEPVLDYLREHRDVAAVQPKILSWHDKDNASCRFEHAGAAGGFIDKLGYPYCRGRILNQVEYDHGQYDTETDIFWASGACLILRTAVFNEVGGLDADFFAHMEEIDLCWRLLCRGWRIVCLPQQKVYHLGGGALPYTSPRKTYLNFRNSLFTLYKNLPARRLWWVLTIRCILDYTAALAFALKGEKDNALAVFQARHDWHKQRINMKPKRKENIRLTKTQPRMTPFSVVASFMLLGKKSFSQLHK